MLVVMQNHATREDIERVVKTIEEMGYEARPMPGSNGPRSASSATTVASTARASRHCPASPSHSRQQTVQTGLARVEGGEHRRHHWARRLVRRSRHRHHRRSVFR
jgi:hypothetical protein